MINKKLKVGNVPNLRFPEFTEEWQSSRLADTCEINPKNEGLPSSFVYIDLESVENGRLLKEDFISKDGAPSRAQRVLSKNDVLFQMVRPYQKNNLFFDKEGKYVASTGYAQIRTKQNSRFIFQYLHNQKFVDNVIERCTGTSYPAINSTDLGNIKIGYPSLEEQTKIASFLSLIDERIQTQNKIIEQLETLIKGLSEKIFSQKIRFKEFTDEWKVKSLGEMGNTFNGLSGKAKEDFGKGIPYIQYKQIFDSAKVQIKKCGLVEIAQNENQNSVKYGDIFFTISSETPDEIGMSSVLLDEVNEMYLNSFCFGYRPFSLQVLNPLFASYLFRSSVFRNEIVKLAQGSTRYNMSKIGLMKLTISLPSSKEQITIARFLSSIDQKLQTEKNILDKYQSKKQFLLQNLFI
ncbi:hypothetical protein BFF93_02055 [Elizabethkingia meningoseptica]|uniref:restriction endonuclease subunit S n=4 Tax=Elizabethkingia TaxID=308865 RepID=UPI0008A8FFFA|nr:restriction endonuclease subunit S [Elizabethkingia meningoseptica]OHT30464.1 hypothetical protein BFF93_02055 [Elizabethkingia meningoseptica]